ncbi:mitochondrial fission ELM1 family protein [Marinobacter fonticola]|uniref:mitochondrial fission ELM1 family protein n=1 Tax=Marinobacter fonticola TaxID=2603215 RepID=UPI0011E7AABE|nr:ELM1/GtrOC1 family putative glycosyltransferase [Marinobacter fonticola]
MNAPASPVVWLLHDDRRGHQVQLKGLGNRLIALASAKLHWIDCTAIKVPLWRVGLGLSPSLAIPEPYTRPDIIVGAGARTHRLLATQRRKRGVHTVVLMRPAFPKHWIDSRIIPAHDHVAETPDTLITCGALNTLTPIARLTTKQNALILVGGPSKHFQWDSASVLRQIDQLRQNYPRWHWTVSSSRRTPEDVIEALNQRSGVNFTVHDHRQTHAHWLAHMFANSRAAWITPDSVSMVYESLTAGVPTGLLTLPARSNSRVANGVEALLHSGRTGSLADAEQIMSRQVTPPEPLWEADRAARWLLGRCRESRQ